jgi:ABC-type phosphate transport system substrate-binding protein
VHNLRSKDTELRSKRLLLAAGAGLAALSLIAPSAIADPSGAPTFRALAGAGSVTTQNVLNALSDAVLIGGVKQIGSYDATGSAQVTTKASGCTNIPRPSGSGAGVGALQDSLEGVANPGCWDFARSSVDNSASNPSSPPGGPGKLSYVPFAIDAVTYVIRDDSGLPIDLPIGDLRSIYDCALSTSEVKPLLPQASSGTRQAFLQNLGYTATEIANFNATSHPCVNFTQATTENVGTTVTDPINIAPYSVGDYLAQINRKVGDVHGRTILGNINGQLPTAINQQFSFQRSLFNVIPSNKETTAPWSTVFVGGGSQVCAQQNIIRSQGFLPDPNCGVITIRTS